MSSPRLMNWKSKKTTAFSSLRFLTPTNLLKMKKAANLRLSFVAGTGLLSVIRFGGLNNKAFAHCARSVFFFSFLGFASKLAASSEKEKATALCAAALL
jgi:hypothetical protein